LVGNSRKELAVYENEIAAAKKVKAYLESALTKCNRVIFDLERKQHENVASETVVSSGSTVQVHPPVESPDKGASPPKRRSRR